MSETFRRRRPPIRTRSPEFAGRNEFAGCWYQIDGFLPSSMISVWNPRWIDGRRRRRGGGGRVVAGRAMKPVDFFCSVRLDAPHSMDMWTDVWDLSRRRDCMLVR
jgi:hypothetical protein